MQPPIHPGNFETFFNRSEPNGGFAKHWPIPLGAWNLVTDEGDLAFGPAETGTNDIFAYLWNATATTDDYIVLCGMIPLDYDPDVDKLLFRYRVRKLDTTGSASDNADLAFVHTLVLLGADDATEPRTVTIANHVLAADLATDTLASFELIEIDLSGNNIKPGEMFSLKLVTNEAVGTNLALNLIGTEFRYYANASFHDRFDRYWS
jgi:hypothetical protein